jgi:primosomal protein N' (replication factor Y)
MLFAQPQVPTAGLVIATYPDAGFHLPDFRSAEHTYRALLEAMALARTDGNGRFIIQTYLPHHHAIQAISRHDSSIFIGPELAYRQMLQYPPFSHLIRLDVSGESEQSVKRVADHWADALRHALDHIPRTADGSSSAKRHAAPRAMSVLGPVPAPVPRVRGRYQWQLIVNSDLLEEGLNTVRSTLAAMEREPRSGSIKLMVDVDPLTML